VSQSENTHFLRDTVISVAMETHVTPLAKIQGCRNLQ